MNPMLSADKVCKSYGAVKILKDVSFSVMPGELFAVIGPNGAGKTTLFNLLTGEVPGNGGVVRLRGEDITRLKPADRVHRGVGRTFQVARVFPEFSALQNLVVALEARHRWSDSRAPGKPWQWQAAQSVLDEAHGLLDSLELRTRADVQARMLSHGDRKRLEFALMLSQEPGVLMLDEPMAGTAADDRQTMADLIRRIQRERGVTVIMTEHDMDIVFSMADRIMVLNYGEIIALGTPEEVRASPEVKRVYLGQEAEHA